MGLIIALLVLAALAVLGLTLTFYICWWYDRRNFPEQAELPGDRPISVLRAGVAVLWEWLCLSLLLASYPLRLLHDASPVRSRHHGERPVILVHGYGGNSANFLLMQWRLRRRGWANVYSVSYTPPHINARKLAAQVKNHVEHILSVTGADQANVVCHSMGGPLIRYALKNLELEGKVAKVITLGSPHQGSRVAALFPPMGAAAQLRYQSPFITELAEGGSCPGGARYYSIFSNMDNFVLPVSTAVLQGAEENIQVPYLGHCALLYSHTVLEHVERCLLAGPRES
ncbi:hypothetical protein A11A3_08125 [Alcanivorax hongdengensis A-11-3]|uniref:Lipase n=1 Tax=Alcanivorax hongdengensis A-11-3 TaxID=1177179 RepID=L0WCW1_9GAMM|nr:alpha/beta fold hydrolase [Alcanivorax hongdengensis]EKF74578.1 hypothetical protein A11A3_08125 [Alcanivorax hongdengensis A-11-3]